MHRETVGMQLCWTWRTHKFDQSLTSYGEVKTLFGARAFLGQTPGGGDWWTRRSRGSFRDMDGPERDACSTTDREVWAHVEHAIICFVSQTSEREDGTSRCRMLGRCSVRSWRE